MNVVLSRGNNLERNNQFDSGADLRAKGFQRIINDKVDSNIIWLSDGDDFFIKPNETVLIKTGVQMELPNPELVIKWGKEFWSVCETQIRPRSGLTLKESVLANLGTIDNDYVGDCGVIFTNNRSEPYRVKHNDRVAQLVINEVLIPSRGFNVVDSLNETTRGEKGFGDSGKN